MKSSSEQPDLSPEERLEWLRSHGIEVVTPPERKASQVAEALQAAEALSLQQQATNGTTTTTASSSYPQQFTATPPSLPTIDGTHGKAKQENGFSWTQTEEELELVVPLTSMIVAKDIHVDFQPQSLHVTCQGIPILDHLSLFERVSVDDCTWVFQQAQSATTTTIANDEQDASSSSPTVVITMEKVEPALWIRIRD